MTLQELIDAVYVETNRSDLDTQTLQAVLAATSAIHGVDFFYKDAISAQIVFDSPLYVQTLDTSALPRFRQLFYARKNSPNLSPYQQNPQLLPPVLDPVTGAVNFSESMGFLKVLDPNDILDDYGTEKLNVCYAAGSSIWIKSSTALQYALLSWYAYPDISVAGYSSWIAEQKPYAIIFKAASKIFQTAGKNDVARTYDRPPNPQIPNDQGGLVQEQVTQLINDNLLLGRN